MVSELIAKKKLDELSPCSSMVMAPSPTSVVRREEAGETVVEPMFLTSPAASSWPTLTPSAKSLRTKNPIREIVDPIVASIQSGVEREDGKELISLAVRVTRAKL